MQYSIFFIVRSICFFTSLHFPYIFRYFLLRDSNFTIINRRVALFLSFFQNLPAIGRYIPVKERHGSWRRNSERYLSSTAKGDFEKFRSEKKASGRLEERGKNKKPIDARVKFIEFLPRLSSRCYVIRSSKRTGIIEVSYFLERGTFQLTFLVKRIT